MASRQSSQGFTLIELMVTVAILAILLSTAIPAYQNYTIRAKVSECLHLTALPKLYVAEYFFTSGQLPPNQTRTGYTFGATRYCASIEISEGGVITVTSKDTGAAEDPAFVMRPDVSSRNLAWRCERLAGFSGHLPASCRNLP